MATTKATKKSTSSRATAAKKTTAKKPASSSAAAKTTKPTVVSNQKKELLPKNIANRILAEIIGTFVLALVALTTASMGALYVGLALVVVVLGVGAISGAHINPAVTFGLWTMRKINWATGLVYWGAQFVGAMLAVAVANLASGGQFAMSFDFMAFNWSLFTIELVGAAVFLFGLAAVVSRDELSAGAKAFGVGLSLTIGLVAAGSLLNLAQTTAYQKYQSESSSSDSSKSFPHELMVKGAVLNPAVALAVTENTESQLTSGVASEGEKATSRFGLEVVVGSLVGAAIGANLFVLTSYRPRKQA